MLKETIKYTDYNEEERTETFWFNLTKSEVTEMEMSINGGLVEKINKMVELKDGAQIMAMFKDMILKAYGEKSADGRRFVKSEELSLAFSQTPAYDDLFMRLVTDPNAAAAFVNGIIPKDINN